jgi:DNA-binding transcriptional ArsR family regulator
MATTVAPAPPALTTGVMALRCGVLSHHLRQLAEAGLVPAQKAGRYWFFSAADAPAVRKAAEKAGVLQAVG